MSTEDFDAKVAWVKAWTYGGTKVTNEEKLTCYGLYKLVPGVSSCVVCFCALPPPSQSPQRGTFMPLNVSRPRQVTEGDINIDQPWAIQIASISVVEPF